MQNQNSSNQTDQQSTDSHPVTPRVDAYWKANLRLLSALLSVWFMVSFGFGILLVDWLDQFSFFGFKLGFWFAQQGAIYDFIVLIFVYGWRMKKIDVGG